MIADFDDLTRDALDLNANYAAIAQVSKIKFVEDFRKACEQNTCTKYNTNWVCPPAVGDFEVLKEQACKYKQGLLFQTVHQLKNSFDWKGMMSAKKIHDEVFRNIFDKLKNGYKLPDMLPLNAGACEVCTKCSYLDNEPCRFPEKAFSSLEAYCIDVINLEKTCGIPYYNGKDTVSYVGLILFNTNG